MTEPEVAFSCKKRGAVLEKLGFVAGRHVAHVQIHGRKLAPPPLPHSGRIRNRPEKHSTETQMKAILETSSLILIGLLLGAILLALPACITVRQSGAHDTTINITGDANSLSMVAHRESSAQSADAEPKLSAVGDEALKTAAKTAVALGTAGASTIPQAATAIAKNDAAPLSPQP
jgi:hypothetical protein